MSLWRIVLRVMACAAVRSAVLPAVSLAASKPSIGAPAAEVGGNEATLKAAIRPGGPELRRHHKTLVVSSQSAKSGKTLGGGAVVAVKLGPARG